MEPHPSLFLRKIIHVDMDAFYASVEERDNPALKGRPLVIGGSPQSRGVVCTANYVARQFGVRSAMACSRAFRLCPQAVFLPPRFEAYTQVSRQIRAIFSRYTALIEPLSLDEAYLDVTSSTLGLYASQIARRIQGEILAETGLSCSVGVAPNKLVAKIASDHRKPGGLTVVPPADVRPFMSALPVRSLFGVGPVTEKRLQQAGFRICSDFWKHSPESLQHLLGSFSEWLWWASQGVDTRAVETDWERKSLGREETFAQDLADPRVMRQEIQRLAHQVAQGLDEENLMGRTVVLKVKYANFQSCSRRISFAEPTAAAAPIAEAAMSLLGRTEAASRKVRLLGVSVSALVEGRTPVQVKSFQNIGR